MAGKFEVYKDAKGKHRFRLKAANGQIIAVGEAYESMSACMGGIDSIRANAPGAAVLDLTTAGAQAKPAMKPAGAKPSGAKHAEMKSGDMKHADMKHADMKSADMKSADMKSADMKGGDMNSGDMKRPEPGNGEARQPAAAARPGTAAAKPAPGMPAAKPMAPAKPMPKPAMH